MAFGRGKKGKEVVGGAPAAEPERISNKLEHVLVAENKLDRKQRLKATFGKITSHKRFKPAAIAFGVLVVLSGLLIYFSRDKQPPAVVDDGPKCTYQMLEKAKPNLEPKNVTKLEPQVREIEQIAGYDTDVNCLYVALTYYIHMGDAPKARELYDKLAAVYDPLERYETVIIDKALPPENLKPIVEALEEQTKRYENGQPKLYQNTNVDGVRP